MHPIKLKEQRRPHPHGRVTLWSIDAAGLWLPRAHQQNQIQAGWAFIAAKQLGYKRKTGPYANDYSLSRMYLEFENVADPADPVDVPDYGVEEGPGYYQDLAESSVRDYLRVPLTNEPTLSIASGFEEFFTEGFDGNQLTFFAQSAGTSGTNGRTFSAAENSKLFGVALVATPFPSDQTQDVIFARTYFDVSDQIVKEASGQLGVTWEIVFEV